MRNLSRNHPQLDNQTFRITRGRTVRGFGMRPTAVVPLEGYWREATCQEVTCEHHERGWITTIDLSPTQAPDDLIANQQRSYYIRHNSGRKATIKLEGSKEVFTFEAGQTCFRTHRLPIQRDPVFLHIPRAGSAPKRLEYDEFHDTFNESAYRLNRRRQEG